MGGRFLGGEIKGQWDVGRLLRGRPVSVWRPKMGLRWSGRRFRLGLAQGPALAPALPRVRLALPPSLFLPSLIPGSAVASPLAVLRGHPLVPGGGPLYGSVPGFRGPGRFGRARASAAALLDPPKVGLSRRRIRGYAPVIPWALSSCRGPLGRRSLLLGASLLPFLPLLLLA